MIPDFQTIMLPLLRYSAEQKAEISSAQARLAMEDYFQLSDQERQELLPSGRVTTIQNRTGWAKTYLVKAGLLRSVRRGFFQITDRGIEILTHAPEKITIKFLEQFQEFLDFKKMHKHKTAVQEIATNPGERDLEKTPEEQLEEAYTQLKSELADELITTIKSCSPAFFENLVIDLLVNMGYGGSRREAGQAVGRSGDGGIDGIIKEDKLGLDAIYVQAKRWEGTVGRPEIQKFAGALQGQRARKGIFISSSSYSKEALEYVKHIDTKIILIDGIELANLMIDYNVGVTPLTVFEIKRIDNDYFEE